MGGGGGGGGGGGRAMWIQGNWAMIRFSKMLSWLLTSAAHSCFISFDCNILCFFSDTAASSYSITQVLKVFFNDNESKSQNTDIFYKTIQKIVAF